MERQIITITTDFGTGDGYVGAVKGVIKRINPHCELVDITHQIEPFDVLSAAFTLNNFYRYFPPTSIHLVVVDPGVGSRRQPLLIKSEDFFFVGPDNGVFSFVYQNERLTEIVHLTKKKYFLSGLSHTFHARDVFAPVAAYLSLGVDPNEFGQTAKECFKLLIPEPKYAKDTISGRIIHIDAFGNLVTNIGSDLLKEKVNKIVVGRRMIKGMSKSYFDIPPKQVGALVGSSGFLEIAANQKNAQKILKSKIGMLVKVSFA
jgi:hypothetical protein